MVSKPLGGWVREVVSICWEGVGGEAGGTSRRGRGPGLHQGMCLLGTAAGVPRCEVLIERCGGGVAVRSMLAGAAHTSVALILYIGRVEVNRVVVGWAAVRRD